MFIVPAELVILRDCVEQRRLAVIHAEGCSEAVDQHAAPRSWGLIRRIKFALDERRPRAPERTSCEGTVAMNPFFDIEIVERDHTLILKVRGELDLATAPLLNERLEQAEAANPPIVLVDLDQVEFMDSTGLHVLLARFAHNGNGTRYSLTRGSPQVRRLFEVAGVIDRLPFAAD